MCVCVCVCVCVFRRSSHEDIKRRYVEEMEKYKTAEAEIMAHFETLKVHPTHTAISCSCTCTLLIANVCVCNL